MRSCPFSFRLGFVFIARDLIDAMNELESQDAKIAKVHCRYGSRLPWKECHGVGVVGEHRHCMIQDGQICWRYSPLANCPRDLTKKIHYKCCWAEAAKPRYQNNSNGQLCGTMVLAAGNNAMMQGLIRDLTQRKAEAARTGNLDGLMFPEAAGMSRDELRAQTAQMMANDEAAHVRV